MIDRLTYGDQDFAGTIRTQNKSGNPISPGVLGTNHLSGWVLASTNDVYGSYASTGGDVGNPGQYVIPEPTTAAMLVMLLVALGFVRRR